MSRVYKKKVVSKNKPKKKSKAKILRNKNRVIGSIIGKYFEVPKINQESIKAIDAFLAVEAERVHQEFALQWFENNKEAIEEEGIIIPEGASDDWKISVVFSSREKGGMGSATDIFKSGYKQFKNRADKIGILRADIKKHKIPFETLFILLNYLQKVVGDDKDQKRLYLAKKELAGKITNKDLYKIAEKEIAKGDFESKRKYIDKRINTAKEKILAQKNEDLIDKEWQKFNELSYWQQKDFYKKLGINNGRVFLNKDDFKGAFVKYAKEKGIEYAVLCSFLNQGYKPHEAEIKGVWFLGTEKVIIPQNNSFEEVFVRDYENFVSGVMAKYATSNQVKTMEELEVSWEEEYVKRIKVETERQAFELAKSFEKASEEIKRIYQTAREKAKAGDVLALKKEEENITKKIKKSWE